MVSFRRSPSRGSVDDIAINKRDVADHKVSIPPSAFPLSSSSSANMSKNIKAMFKRSGLSNSSKESIILGHAGPMTYPYSFKEVIGYYISKEAVFQGLNSSCSALTEGLCMKRISRRKQVPYIFRLHENEAITWKDGTKRLELDSIKDIRTGDMASNYREEYGVSDKVAGLWVTIIYTVSNKLKALHVVARHGSDFSIFFNCICGLVKSRRELMESISVPDNEKFANIHWHRTVSERKEDEIKDTLRFEDVRRLCDKFHIYCSSSHLLRFFKIADVNHNGLLNFHEFQTFVKLLKERPEVHHLWKSCTLGKNYMDFGMFYNFIRDVQKEDLTKENACELFENFRRPKQKHLDEEDFVRFLGAQPYAKEIEEDYSKPLNHYFIASSHNTYLLGKQVGERPSVEGYVQVLQQGCRCIEIDIWDDDIGPVVCHGFLTTAIPLINVVEIIKKYAFITSPYPLIISLEMNCGKENQLIATSIFQNCFGSLLYYPDDKDNFLPSPMKLRHKIVLKGKKTNRKSLAGTTGNLNSIESSSSSYSSSYDSEVESGNKGKENLYNTSNNSKIRRIKRLTLKRRVEVIDDLLNICGLHGLKFRNLSLPESKTVAHCFSFNEKSFYNMQKDKTQELSLDKHNRRFLTRVYPHALRYKSSNFNPINFWKLGVQMVATNWQTNDLGQQINLAMFQLSSQKSGVAHSGYILKPAKLLPTVSKVQQIPQLYQKLRKNPSKIELKILSAQLLPKPAEIKDGKESSFAPYVVAELFSDEEPAASSTVDNGLKLSNMSAATENCKDNGFNPVWGMNMSATLKSLDFAFVRFTVKTGEISLATSCLRLQYLKPGYRHIPLYSMEGELYIFSTLFIFTRSI